MNKKSQRQSSGVINFYVQWLLPHNSSRRFHTLQRVHIRNHMVVNCTACFDSEIHSKFSGMYMYALIWIRVKGFLWCASSLIGWTHFFAPSANLVWMSGACRWTCADKFLTLHVSFDPSSRTAFDWMSMMSSWDFSFILHICVVATY